MSTLAELIPDILSASELLTTVDYLAGLQLGNGMIPWFDGGHCDPWNHVEAAMALSIDGRDAEVEAAYDWLAETQLGDGSWFNYYRAEGVKDQRIDTNVCAYLAVGLWHYSVLRGSESLLIKHRAMIEKAMNFVVAHQRNDGTMTWSRDASGRAEGYALLTGSSSILLSLRCAITAFEAMGTTRPDWELAAGRLAHAIAQHQGAFAPKREFAMDWYYPVLSGALGIEAGNSRIDRYWDEFVMEGRGVRCVSTEPWVTAAETAELVITLESLGRHEQAMSLFASVQAHRQNDGSYLTGVVYPDEVSFPHRETSSYTAAAVVLAADALAHATPASDVLGGAHLAGVVGVPSPTCSSRH